MADHTHLLLRSNLKQLRLPTMGAEFEKLAREASSANEACGVKYLVVHRRPDYPLAGCVPAEPASVSPGDRNVTKKQREKQVQALMSLI